MDSCKTSFDVLEFYTIYEYVYGIRLLQNNMDITNKYMKYQVYHQQIREVTWFILNEVPKRTSWNILPKRMERTATRH